MRGKSPAVGRGSGGGGLFESSWVPSWASVQGLASSFLSGGEPGFGSESDRTGSRDASRAGRPRKQASHSNISKKAGNWGPEPPNEPRPRLNDVAAGSMAKREAALKAMRTASVLESHEGVNGGLDAAGHHKKRNSDEEPRGSAQQEESEEHLVYIHHVQPSDTYAGIVLKYKCREDAFRKANGLWSRDGIQVRKWLTLPVDACEVRGRPCEGPSTPSARVDLLARTPEETDPFGGRDSRGDFFASNTDGHSSDHPKPSGDEERPWTHVRWVSIDSCPHPVEIARVPRKALGYFPPRRKKSIHTASTTLSTPRGSFDVPSITLGSEAGGGLGSPGSASSRRQSLLSGRPQLNTLSSNQFATGRRSRVNSIGINDDLSLDPRPAWMRRPGGVGSLGKSVRAPGPERDYFNSWTKRHLPGLINVDSMSSMSVMGSESARFGFGNAAENGPAAAALVEGLFEGGRDETGASEVVNHQGSGLDKAALALEIWLRGAFAKRGPATPVLGPRGRPGAPAMEGDGDLIELADTNSDDGRGFNLALAAGGDLSGLLSSVVSGPTGWSAGDGGGTMRGRNASTVSGGSGGADKSKKTD